jgi:hypothetical protein
MFHRINAPDLESVSAVDFTVEAVALASSLDLDIDTVSKECFVHMGGQGPNMALAYPIPQSWSGSKWGAGSDPPASASGGPPETN